MFILKHKELPYYLTWEANDESWEFYKDQIDLEMKSNGINSFHVARVGNKKPAEDDRKPASTQDDVVKKTRQVKTPPSPPQKKVGKGPRTRKTFKPRVEKKLTK